MLHLGASMNLWKLFLKYKIVVFYGKQENNLSFVLAGIENSVPPDHPLSLRHWDKFFYPILTLMLYSYNLTEVVFKVSRKYPSKDTYCKSDENTHKSNLLY